MPGKMIRPRSFGLFAYFLNIVHKPEDPHLQNPLIHQDPRFLIPPGMQDVMVAQRQSDPQIGEIIPPAQKKIQLFILPRMEQIAHDQQLFRLKILDQRQQPQQILPVNRLWNRDPRLPEMPRLTKMQIGKDQRSLFLPKNTPVRR